MEEKRAYVETILEYYYGEAVKDQEKEKETPIVIMPVGKRR